MAHISRDQISLRLMKVGPVVCCNVVVDVMISYTLGHHAVEAAKNIYWANDDGAFEDSTVTRWLKKFGSGCKTFGNQERSGST